MAQATIARSGWDFEVERGPDWLFVRPRKIGDGSTASFAEQVGALLDQQFTHRLVLELGDVGPISSELADQLIGLHKRIQLQDGLMRVCELTEVQEDVLHARCSESHFSRYRTREDAVMGHSHPRQPR